MQGLDATVFRWINGGWANPGLDPVMLLVTTLGTGAVQAVIGLLLAGTGWFTRRVEVRRSGYAGLIACAIATLVVQLTKNLCCRPRPLLVIHDARYVGDPLFTNSFPSGHTATAFAVAVACSMLVPRLRWVLIPLAVAVGFSRIYVGAHYPLDVVGGAAMGTLVGLWSARIVRGRRKGNQ